MNQHIQGKVIVITGASSGLGEATARLLGAEGARVVLGARRAGRLQALVAELAQQGHEAIAVGTDVTDRAQVQKLVDTAVQSYGRIDVMLNNAGLMPHSPLERLKVEDWDRMIDVNLRGVLYGIAAALPQMQRQQARGDLFATGDDHVVFGRIVQGAGFAAEIDQPVGLAGHGRNDHRHLVPGGLLTLDNPRHAADALGTGHRRATEFHHDAGQRGCSHAVKQYFPYGPWTASARGFRGGG